MKLIKFTTTTVHQNNPTKKQADITASDANN